MSRIVIVILIYHRHKPIDLIDICNCRLRKLYIPPEAGWKLMRGENKIRKFC
jgi:hypothetical protein